MISSISNLSVAPTWLWFAFEFGKDLGIQFLTGYLVEKSLSVDNLFIILLIFQSFRIPDKYQHRVLFYGVLGAIVLRAFFIIMGAQLLNTFHWILYVFGAVLVITAINFLRKSDEKIDVNDHWSMRFIRRFIPTTTSFQGNNFFYARRRSAKGDASVFSSNSN